VTRPILFLSDYGLGDEYVGLCHAVIARLSPDVRVIDLAHGIPPQDVLSGALTLESAVPHAPDDTVYLAVVDPGVGTDRRAIAVDAAGQSLVGPDNGVLWLAFQALGGVRMAVELDPRQVARGPVSATFHGRDLFAPAAARLAAGAALEDLGARIDPSTIERLAPVQPEVEDGRLVAVVLGVDRFGNVRLGGREADLARAGLGEEASLEVRAGERATRVRRVGTFADVSEGDHALLVDSAGRLAIVRNRGRAADTLALRRYDHVSVSRPNDGVG
jgi:S-adenosylmethionine hydrolase